jgi:hypothetical protein
LHLQGGQKGILIRSSAPNVLALGLCIAAAIPGLGLSSASAQPVPVAVGSLDELDADAWLADLDAYLEVLRISHPNPYHTTSQARFEVEVARMRVRIETGTTAERIAAIARVAALVGDGHTWMPLYRIPFKGAPEGPAFAVLPVRLASFSDGLFVVGASDAHAGVLGRRVTRIGDVDTEEAVRRVLTLLPTDATNFSYSLVDEWLLLADVLRALGIAGTGPIALETDSGARVELDAAPPREDFDWIGSIDTSAAEIDSWRVARVGTPPLFRREPDSALRVTDLGDVVYAQIRQIGDEGDFTFEAFAGDLAARLGAMDTPRLVLDLRLCPGGDGSLNHHLVDALAGVDFAANHLTVLIGNGTHSAAIMLLSDLERRTPACFVGAPAADRPNHYGETNIFVLPNSLLPVLHASEYHETGGERDARRAHAPQVAVAPSFDDYASGHDPALAAALETMK